MLSLKDLEDFLDAVDRALGPPIDLVLVGGTAVQLLCRDPDRRTRDIDTLSTDTIPVLVQIAATHLQPIDINDRAALFESYLPDDWQDRVRLVFDGPRKRLRVVVPCPEDLAIMKVFRMGPKDEDDLLKLASLPGFDREGFRDRFLRLLPVAIGPERRHAQFFAEAWNGLFPDELPLDIDDVLKAAGAVRSA
jgi:hypothetical protein